MSIDVKRNPRHNMCTKCGLTNNPIDFNWYRYTTQQGKQSLRRESACRECKKAARNLKLSAAASKRWKDKNKEHLIKYAKEYRKSIEAKAIRAAAQRQRNAAQLKRTPRWANLEEIKTIYLQASVLGMEVDHIIPLRGTYVSGLHVTENLQLLTKTENCKKKNKFDLE